MPCVSLPAAKIIPTAAARALVSSWNPRGAVRRREMMISLQGHWWICLSPPRNVFDARRLVVPNKAFLSWARWSMSAHTNIGW
jgi:hypothetical protein